MSAGKMTAESLVKEYGNRFKITTPWRDEAERWVAEFKALGYRTRRNYRESVQITSEYTVAWWLPGDWQE